MCPHDPEVEGSEQKYKKRRLCPQRQVYNRFHRFALPESLQRCFPSPSYSQPCSALPTQILSLVLGFKLANLSKSPSPSRFPTLSSGLSKTLPLSNPTCSLKATTIISTITSSLRLSSRPKITLRAKLPPLLRQTHSLLQTTMPYRRIRIRRLWTVVLPTPTSLQPRTRIWSRRSHSVTGMRLRKYHHGNI